MTPRFGVDFVNFVLPELSTAGQQRLDKVEPQCRAGAHRRNGGTIPMNGMLLGNRLKNRKFSSSLVWVFDCAGPSSAGFHAAPARVQRIGTGNCKEPNREFQASFREHFGSFALIR
jgi:hypothetical protein